MTLAINEIDKVRECWNYFRPILQNKLSDIITHQDLTINASWDLDFKTIGEIGGRLLEDCFLNQLIDRTSDDDRLSFVRVKARAIGDIECKVPFQGGEFTFHIDVKCNYLKAREKTLEYYNKHNIKGSKPGETHPNLMSVSKLEEFFSSGSFKYSDIVELFFSYDIKKENKHIHFLIEDNFPQSKLFLLRDIGENNFTVGNLGRGQIQMYRFHDLMFCKRTMNDFIDLVRIKKSGGK